MPADIYSIVFALSFLMSILYVCSWRKFFDTNITAIFIVIPVINLGYAVLYNADNESTALVAIKITYLSACYLTFFITMCVMNLCEIEVKRAIRSGLFIFNSCLYALVLTIGQNDLIYKDFKITPGRGSASFAKVYGPFHTVIYFVVILYFIAGLVAILYTLSKKKQAPRRILYMLFAPVILSFVSAMARNIFIEYVDISPISYFLAQILYLLIVRRMSLYKVGDIVIESMVRSGDTGFITVDNELDFLGANETARDLIPGLKKLRVDSRITKEEELKDNVSLWITRFASNSDNDRNMYVTTGPDGKARFYQAEVDHLFDGGKKCGYQIFLKDDTRNQQYISLIDNYNNELKEEVKKQTDHIVEMHDNLILGMATMVEGRDNSTGGHIRRTSDVVKMLIEEIRSSETFRLDSLFCNNLIKAAPLHDIGKITVDDAVLRKPGRFTDEEYAQMKKHAPEGARILNEILNDPDNEYFRDLAVNVAHYHHERWDGTGYPDGLKGKEIPLEARIMAIADVYDALVSKRVYKEKMSFEQADRIIMDGFGTQFDPALRLSYMSARPKLEEYYSKED